MRVIDALTAESTAQVPRDGFATEDYERRVNRRPLVTEHPVVRVYPDTEEKGALCQTGFTSHIVDVSPHESRRLLGLFYDELARTPSDSNGNRAASHSRTTDPRFTWRRQI